MAVRHRALNYRAKRATYGHSVAHHRRGKPRSAIGLLAFVLGLPLIVGTIAMAIIGIVAVAGGFSPEYMELRYPKPDGYKLNGRRLEHQVTLCVDPREGPSVDWTLLELAQDAVAIWRAAAPSLPLEVSGICQSADGDGGADGRIRWQRMEGLWGQARGTDISLNPDISPATWACAGAVAKHEIGHLIGLDHQREDVPSIMTPSGCDHELSLLDVAAVRHLYEGRSKR